MDLLRIINIWIYPVDKWITAYNFSCMNNIDEPMHIQAFIVKLTIKTPDKTHSVTDGEVG